MILQGPPSPQIRCLLVVLLTCGCFFVVETGKVETENPKEISCSSESDETCFDSTPREDKVPSNLEECGVWVAPSSIPGAGLGMYAGRNFEAGELLQASGEVVVPEIDTYSHQYEKVKNNQFMFLWDEYTWSGAGLHMDTEGFVDVKAQSPGFGSAANSFIDLVNVDERRPFNSIPQGLHRSKDPGVGAFSTYHNRESVATVPIQKGEEFFVDYGQQWFIDRPHFGPIPLFGDLQSATDLFRRHLELRHKHHKVSNDIWDEMWYTFVDKTDFSDSRVMGAFTRTQEEWSGLFAGKSLKEIRIEEGRRDDAWLREHGTCSDNMKEGESTIPQAGRGAFATRRLVAGSVVAPLPLIHVRDKSILDMLEFEDIRSLKTNNVRQGIQLTMNYCFGHPASTLLLCPYGPLTSLINHNQTQANVELQWADPAKGNHQPEIMESPIEFWAHEKTAKLAMELVATREIMPGEEIFLDYGSEWEEAWHHHVANWRPHYGAENYMSAYQLNISPDRLRTEFEQMESPYPGNVNLQCDHKFFQHIDHDRFHQTGEIMDTNYHGASWKLCEVLRFEEVKGILRYTAVALVNETMNEKLSFAPRAAFRFVDRPYTSDMFLPNAFRHAMMIPNHMFPEQWRNL